MSRRPRTESRRPRATSRRLGVESLEDRRMMAVTSAVLTSGTLRIQTDNRSSDVHTYKSGTQLVVVDNAPGATYLTPPTWRFSGTVNRIEFRGGSGDDTFVNDAYIPVTAYGNGGDDYLEGGNRNDILYGGDGDDTLVGYGGNDRLYGGNGDDILKGMSGNDSLYGGGNESVDELWGGSGADRFLTQHTDVIKDGSGLNSATGADVELRFRNRGESWSNREIEELDAAFQTLFDAKGSNRLLRDPQTTAPLTFYQDKLAGGTLGENTVFTTSRGCTTSGPWYNPTTVCDYRTRFDHREITITEWNETSSSENTKMRNTLIHEIGHNFQEGAVNTSSLWSQFLSLSGWVQNPSNKTGLTRGQYVNASGTRVYDDRGWYRSNNSSSAFASGYAMYRPPEDWAETWELYFRNGRSTSNSNSTLAAKLRLVDSLIRGLA